MGNIQIGFNIAAKRKMKGLTQEELAQHMGVSKPAVSKWESGQSYPDILLLPVLAAYFNISVDELIGYEPQMEAADIRKLYRRLANAFAKDPFERVYGECQDYIKKYYSCWRLQVQMGLLLINHAALSGNTEKITDILKEALDIFIRVEKASDDVNLAKQAIQLQAVCYLALQQPAEVIDLLTAFDEPFMSAQSLLVKAYQMKGDGDKAIEILQGSVFVNLMTMIGACSDFLLMYTKDAVRMEDCYRKFLELGKLFGVQQMSPYAIIQIHLSAAGVFASLGEKEKALDALEAFLDLFKQIEKQEIRLKGNDFFHALEGYLTSIYVDSFPPRNELAIHNDLINAVILNPAFAELETEERGQQIIKRLKESIK